MIDETQTRKSMDKMLKQVTKKVIVLDENVIDIILSVHCQFQDTKKVLWWLKTKNPMFGNIEPIKLINLGKSKRVKQCVDDMIEGNFA